MTNAFQGRSKISVMIGALLCSLVLVGCVSVPSAGNVEKVEAGSEASTHPFEIEGQPPKPGDQPRVIVDGFLEAMLKFQSGYPVARQYLTKSAAGAWRPDEGVSIYSDGVPTVTSANSVRLDARLSATLGSDGAFTQRDGAYSLDFGLVKENGAWRISRPPKGLLVSQAKFEYYSSYNLYFLEPRSGSLVPDPIYLPQGANVESTLITRLLAGPTTWLKPAVRTAFPLKTTLSVQSVSVTDGIAEVNFNDSLLGLNEEERSLMAAQVIWTLKQIGGSDGGRSVDGVRFEVNGSAYPIKEQVDDPQLSGGPYVKIGAYQGQIAPIDDRTSTTLYGLGPDGVVKVDDAASPPELVPVAGPLGKTKLKIDSLAASTAGTDLALVTNDRSTLRLGPQADAAPATIVSGADDLLRPQFTRFEELWAVGKSKGAQSMWVNKRGKSLPVSAAALASSDIRAFRISPDGVRMALIRKVGERSELGLARITRGDTVTVDGWRTIKLTGTGTAGLTKLSDVAWLDPSTLVVLAAASSGAALVPYQVDQDASEVMPIGQSEDLDASMLTTSPQGGLAIAIGKGKSWKYDEARRWVPFSDKVSSLAYPG